MIGSIPINIHHAKQDGALSFIWCELSLEYHIYRKGKLIDKVGAQYAEQNRNWRQEIAKKWKR